MISPEARERLASLMDDRRLELGLRWRDVAEAGGVSYEALRDVRNGTGGIRRLTERAIEVGLQWESGSVQLIEAGSDPIPLSGSSGGAAGTTAPPLSARERAAQRWGPVGEMVALAMQEPRAVVEGEVASGRVQGLPERDLFPDPREALIWSMDALPESERIAWIAYKRVRDDRQNTTAVRLIAQQGGKLSAGGS